MSDLGGNSVRSDQRARQQDGTPEQRGRLDDRLGVVGMDVVAFDAAQAALAREAYLDFGRGSGHAAGFNVGDWFTYALHRLTGQPVLYGGKDFSAAGVPNALHR